MVISFSSTSFTCVVVIWAGLVWSYEDAVSIHTLAGFHTGLLFSWLHRSSVSESFTCYCDQSNSIRLTASTMSGGLDLISIRLCISISLAVIILRMPHCGGRVCLGSGLHSRALVCLYYGHEYIERRLLLPGMMTHVEYFHIYENVHIYKHENKATQPPCLLLLIHASCRCRLWQISGIISICQVDNNTTPEYRDIYEYLSSSAVGAVILMVLVVVTRLDQGN